MLIRSIAPALAIATLATVPLQAPAHAADYPVLRGSQIEDAPAAPSFATPGWGGFYMGGSGGYTTGRFDAEKQSQILNKAAFQSLTISDSASSLLTFGRVNKDKVNFGGFIGYNVAFGDAVLGIEGDYLRLNLQTDQRNGIGRVFTNIYPTTVPSSAATEPLNTNTAVAVIGHSTNKVEDMVMLKARAGYAFGNFMPFANIGLAVGRVTTNAEIRHGYATIENYSRFNTVSDASGSLTRTTFIGTASFARPDATGSGGATQVSSGYVPGLVLGAGLDALLGDNLLVRAEYNRVYFADYKGVSTVIDTARLGAGIKF